MIQKKPQQPAPQPVIDPTAVRPNYWRPERTALAFGVGLAATGVGAVLGLAAERAQVARMLRGAQAEQVSLIDEETDGRGGPPLGSLRGQARVVLSGEVPLHVEVDEADPDWVHEPAVNRHVDDAEGEPGPSEPGLTVVLSHGYSLSLDAWHYQRLALRGRYRLVLWDQRGHGRSGTGEPGSSTIEQIGKDLGAVIDEVAPHGPLVLLGHSMGGMTVMSLAEQRPELFAERVVGVGLFCTSAGGLGALDLGLSGLGRAMMTVAPTAARLLARQGNLVAHTRRLGSELESLLVRRYSFASPVPAELVRFSAGLIAQTRMEVISDFLPTLSSHDKRVALAVLNGRDLLVMAGEKDLLIPRAHSDDIVAELPDADYVVVRDAGHLLPLEHPQLVNTHLAELLADVAEKTSVQPPTRRRGWGRRTVTPVRERRRSLRAPFSTGNSERGGGHR
ncbi:lipase [Kineosporia sp. NBRC 101677]|uniref:alpha/beta fold hydrolase n=1 Tax=Kineosporia sp. NBRC 101677 TaxID=3032197 RepID=UPI0024A288C4|nr:alpha/beta hydrolase [Kineosporia sp. NBRC 101677]GLY13155.1 lipase [Kineosporia sp. NBRC 101677]